MNRSDGNGHLEHWQIQESGEATLRKQRLARAEATAQRSTDEIQQLKNQLADAAAALMCRDAEIRQATQSLGALSATVAALCELQLANRFDDLREEMERLAENYSQMKAVVTARKVH